MSSHQAGETAWELDSGGATPSPRALKCASRVARRNARRPNPPDPLVAKHPKAGRKSEPLCNADPLHPPSETPFKIYDNTWVPRRLVSRRSRGNGRGFRKAETHSEKNKGQYEEEDEQEIEHASPGPTLVLVRAGELLGRPPRVLPDVVHVRRDIVCAPQNEALS